MSNVIELAEALAPLIPPCADCRLASYCGQTGFACEANFNWTNRSRKHGGYDDDGRWTRGVRRPSREWAELLNGDFDDLPRRAAAQRRADAKWLMEYNPRRAAA